MKCGYMLSEPIILEHVQQCCFACIVQPQEEQLTRFLPQACVQTYKLVVAPDTHRHLYWWYLNTVSNWKPLKDKSVVPPTDFLLTTSFLCLVGQKRRIVLYGSLILNIRCVIMEVKS